MPGPFDGLRVVDVTSLFVGPYASQMLGDMGADVIKIEAPGGDMTRGTGPSVNAGMASNYIHVNRNKRAVALDLKIEGGAEALRKLIRKADVFMHNMRAEPLARLGFDYARVKELKPDIVYCNIWGFGRDGCYADRPAYDDVIQAASGLVALEAFGGKPARYVPLLIADKTTALFAAYAIAAALFHQLKTGEGQEVEVPMFESMVSFTMLEHLWGESFIPARGGAGSRRHATPMRWPHATADGYICVLPASDRHWRRFLKSAGREDLLNSPFVKNRAARVANAAEVMAIMDEIMATKTTRQWVEALIEAGIPFMPISTLDEVIADPHLGDVDFWHEFDHPSEGRMRLMNPPYSLSGTPAAITRPPPRFAEHTRAVLGEMGYGEAEIQRLIDAGAVIEAKESGDY